MASLPSVARQSIGVRMYQNATHAWDRLQPAMTVTDPFSHLGAGGTVDFVPNPGAAFQSRENAVRAFTRAFGLSPPHAPKSE